MPEELTAGARRIGGEMFAWSDWDPKRADRITRSGAVAHVLSELAGAGRAVLIAGPHDEDLVAAMIAQGSEVTWLVRSVSDAERLAARFPSVTVLCGDVAKVESNGGFDLVVCVGGLDRVSSVEGTHAARDVLPTLLGLVAPGGTVAVLHQNPFGVHRWVDLTPGQHYRRDSEWYPNTDRDDTVPASLAQAEEHLVREGFHPLVGYAAFPTPDAPVILINKDELGDTGSPMRGAVSALLSRAFTDAYRGLPVLADPRRLMARALAAGAEGVVAAGWLTIARRGSRAVVPGHAPVPAKAVIVGDANSPITYGVSVVGGRPRLEVLTGPGPDGFGDLGRVDPAGQPVPTGRVFEEQVLQLMAAGDLPGLRAELVRFVNWLESEQVDGAIAGPAALATMGDVLDDGGRLRLVLPRWQPREPVPTEIVVARALWVFANGLITGNRPHPWHLTADAATLTATMLATVGWKLDPETLAAATEFDAAFGAAEGQPQLGPERPLWLYEEVTKVAGRVPPADIVGYRELVDAVWRQEYELIHLRETNAWTSSIIRSRDRALSKMDWEMQLYQASPTRKVFLLLRAIYRSLRRDVRTLLRKFRRPARPSGEMQ
jgi:SAM-dependent methyltransferase